VTEYEYSGLIAESWDLLRGDTSGWADRPFWRRRIEASGQPALDVGCGTGRILLDYLAQGVEIEGVDNSPEMLAICRRKAAALGLSPVLHQQEMDALDLPRRYRTIVVPSSSFQLVVDPAAAAGTLRRFLAHLEPGGTLAMSVMTLSQDGDPDEWRLGRRGEAWRPDGLLVRRWTRSRYDPATELEHTAPPTATSCSATARSSAPSCTSARRRPAPTPATGSPRSSAAPASPRSGWSPASPTTRPGPTTHSSA
jgi:SAM-dependent methyltransferase